MRLLPSDPDIKTIVTRIFDKDINLQPDFQRGEVWGTQKKMRLIDSILRSWHVPPIHVIEIKETGRQEVLDGQQRLVAIRDFVLGDIVIDGNLEPVDEEIRNLDGLKYVQLPDFWKRRFDKFTIRIYNITDYLPSEPGELFYRLNQPTNLTSAEQRNAFFGPARGQVKELVDKIQAFGLTRKELGFSNSRMAYDDVLARLCVYLELETLIEKITATSLADKYRERNGFSSDTLSRVERAIRLFAESTRHFKSGVRFNKATFLSWLIFIEQVEHILPNITPHYMGAFISDFEELRLKSEGNYEEVTRRMRVMSRLLDSFNDRASSRVADITSVLIRDFVIWVLFKLYVDENNLNSGFIFKNKKISILDIAIGKISNDDARTSADFQELLLDIIREYEWGKHI